MNKQPMSAESKAQLIAGYVLNTLDETEAQTFVQMIAKDPAILEDIDQTQQVLEHTYGISEALLPPQLRARVIKAVAPSRESLSLVKPTPSAASPGSLPLIPITPLQNRSSKAVWRWFRIGVASLIFVLGLSNYILWRALRQQLAIAQAKTPQVPQIASLPPKTPAASQILIYTLTTTTDEIGTDMGTGDTGIARVSIDLQTSVAQLTASQLPPLDAGQVYVLWTVVEPDSPFTADAKNAILTATFGVDNQGNTHQQILVPAAFQALEQVAALGITVESETAPQAHEGSPIMLLPL